MARADACTHQGRQTSRGHANHRLDRSRHISVRGACVAWLVGFGGRYVLYTLAVLWPCVRTNFAPHVQSRARDKLISRCIPHATHHILSVKLYHLRNPTLVSMHPATDIVREGWTSWDSRGRWGKRACHARAVETSQCHRPSWPEDCLRWIAVFFSSSEATIQR